MRNIVFTCRHLARSSEDEFWEQLGKPQCEKVIRKDGKPLSPSVPKEYVKTAKWVGWIDEEIEDIKIIDFGEVFCQGEKPARCALPDACRAPEVIFEDEFDHKTDLWQAGCAVCLSLSLTHNSTVRLMVLTPPATLDIHPGLPYVPLYAIWP